jgi:hypothetical protein
MSDTRTCRYCGADIESMGPDIGWVDTLSGDDGGTYDICPERYDAESDTQGAHAPENEPAATLQER